MFTKTLLDNHFWEKKRIPQLLTLKICGRNEQCLFELSCHWLGWEWEVVMVTVHITFLKQVHVNRVNWSTKNWFTQNSGKDGCWVRWLLWTSITTHSTHSCSGSSAGSREKSPQDRPDILHCLTFYHLKTWVSSTRAGTSPNHCLVQGTQTVC